MTSPRSAPAPSPGPNSAALDQWRGGALLCVLVSHGFFYLHPVDGVGRIGVNLFFFISGLLVFRSLAASARTGLPLAVAFWRKRLLRLYPALAGYVAAMGLVVWLLSRSGAGADPGTYGRSVPYALLFWSDYYGFNDLALGHLWSVSVEMQFYLLGPLIYFFGRYQSPRRLALWLVILLLLLSLLVLKVVRGYAQKYELYEFQVAVWPMMLGFICEAQKKWVRRLPRALITGAIWLGVALVCLAMVLAVLGFQKVLVVALGATVFLPCLFCYVDGRSLPGQAGAMLKWCGERTYSVYLWQQPLTICDYLPRLWQPLGALLALPVGAIWYRLLERPFLSTGRRRAIAQDQTAGSGGG